MGQGHHSLREVIIMESFQEITKTIFLIKNIKKIKGEKKHHYIFAES